MSIETSIVNVALRMSEQARLAPDRVAIVEPAGLDPRRYRQITYRELEEDSNRIASGLQAMGVTNGTRLAMLVPPGTDFVSLVFGLLKSGAVAILIDPGMGRDNLLKCLAEAEPEGFVAISKAQAVRTVLRRRFPKSRFHVTVGRRWFWGGKTLDQLRDLGSAEPFNITTHSDDPAAIIFTTGSTGPPKGVQYRHGNFDHQVTEIRDRFDIQPGEVNLSGFPLFGLFNSGMGVTTVFPVMDFTRPAEIDPENIIGAVEDWQVTQSFASPALWNRVGRYCASKGKQLSTIRSIYSAGAPVPGHVLKRMQACIHPEGEVYTPYGATEALPVASISGREVLEETQSQTDLGQGVCVGKQFPGIDWKVIRTTDGPIASLEEIEELSAGEIGELIVSGPVITREYVTRTEANARGKILAGETVWHRMGDTGYLDETDRLWFCGRVAHRVQTSRGTLYTVRCEGIINTHAEVSRSALVGIGPAGSQRPVIIVEPEDPARYSTEAEKTRLLGEIRQLAQNHAELAEIDDFLLHPSLPVDIRHNAKIFREKLAPWAAEQLG